MSQDYEGWSVDARPAVKMIGLFVALLLLLVIGAGTVYNRLYAARTRADPATFPQPELETIDEAPSDRKPFPPPAPPPGIDRAMAETAAKGNALWQQ